MTDRFVKFQGTVNALQRAVPIRQRTEASAGWTRLRLVETLGLREGQPFRRESSDHSSQRVPGGLQDVKPHTLLKEGLKFDSQTSRHIHKNPPFLIGNLYLRHCRSSLNLVFYSLGFAIRPTSAQGYKIPQKPAIDVLLDLGSACNCPYAPPEGPEGGVPWFPCLGSPCRLRRQKLRYKATNMSQWPGWTGSPGCLLCGKRPIPFGVRNRPRNNSRLLPRAVEVFWLSGFRCKSRNVCAGVPPLGGEFGRNST